MRQISAGAGIRIMGNGLDLESITSRMNLSPTHTHHTGDNMIRIGMGDKIKVLDRKYEQDMWSLDSPIGKNKSIDAHLKWLEKQLKPHYQYLLELKRIAKIDVFCFYTGEGDDGGFSFSPKSLSIFSELGIRLEISTIILRAK